MANSKRRRNRRKKRTTPNVSKTEQLAQAEVPKSDDFAPENQLANAISALDSDVAKNDAVVESKAETDVRDAGQMEQLLDTADELTSQHQQLESTNSDPKTFDIDVLQTLIKDQRTELCEQIDARQARLVESFETSIEQMFEKLTQRLDEEKASPTGISNSDQRPSSDSVSPAIDIDDEDSEPIESILTGWEKQKQQMFADYGEGNVAPAVESEPGDSPRISHQASSDSKNELGLLHESIDSIKSIEAEEIEDLREQLTAQLQEAEIEISINRAKLDQKNAELERRQNELERRERAMEKKYSNVAATTQKQGILDRLTRHLTLRKSENLG